MKPVEPQTLGPMTSARYKLHKAVVTSQDLERLRPLRAAGAFRVDVRDAIEPRSWKSEEVFAENDYPQLAVFTGLLNHRTVTVKHPHNDGMMVVLQEGYEGIPADVAAFFGEVLEDFFADHQRICEALADRRKGAALVAQAQGRFEATLSTLLAVCTDNRLSHFIEPIARQAGGLKFLKSHRCWLKLLAFVDSTAEDRLFHPVLRAIQRNQHDALREFLRCGWDPFLPISRFIKEDKSDKYGQLMHSFRVVWSHAWQFEKDRKDIAYCATAIPNVKTQAIILQALQERKHTLPGGRFTAPITASLTAWLAELLQERNADCYMDMNESPRSKDPQSKNRLDGADVIDLVEQGANGPDGAKGDTASLLAAAPRHLMPATGQNIRLTLAMCHGVHELDVQTSFAKAIWAGHFELAEHLAPRVNWAGFDKDHSPFGLFFNYTGFKHFPEEGDVKQFFDIVIRHGGEQLLATPYAMTQTINGARETRYGEADLLRPIMAADKDLSIGYPLFECVRLGFLAGACQCLAAGADPDFVVVKEATPPQTARSLAASADNNTLPVILSFEARRAARVYLQELALGDQADPGRAGQPSP